MPSGPPIPPPHYDGAALAARLRELRELRGLSLREAADAAGLSHPHLSRLERGLAGEDGQVLLGVLWHLAAALEVTPADLLHAALPTMHRVTPPSFGAPRSGHGRPPA